MKGGNNPGLDINRNLRSNSAPSRLISLENEQEQQNAEEIDLPAKRVYERTRKKIEQWAPEKKNIEEEKKYFERSLELLRGHGKKEYEMMADQLATTLNKRYKEFLVPNVVKDQNDVTKQVVLNKGNPDKWTNKKAESDLVRPTSGMNTISHQLGGGAEQEMMRSGPRSNDAPARSEISIQILKAFSEDLSTLTEGNPQQYIMNIAAAKVTINGEEKFIISENKKSPEGKFYKRPLTVEETKLPEKDQLFKKKFVAWTVLGEAVKRLAGRDIDKVILCKKDNANLGTIRKYVLDTKDKVDRRDDSEVFLSSFLLANDKKLGNNIEVVSTPIKICSSCDNVLTNVLGSIGFSKTSRDVVKIDGGGETEIRVYRRP